MGKAPAMTFWATGGPPAECDACLVYILSLVLIFSFKVVSIILCKWFLTSFGSQTVFENQMKAKDSPEKYSYIQMQNILAFYIW